jgi:hypothetical protein
MLARRRGGRLALIGGLCRIDRAAKWAMEGHDEQAPDFIAAVRRTMLNLR